MDIDKKDYDILVLTSSTVDIVIEMEGTFPIEGNCSRRVRSLHPEPGGEANMMIVYSRIGGKVLPVGPIGTDDCGRYLLNTYRKLGIETGYLTQIEEYQTPIANCIIDETGEHSFVSMIGSHRFSEVEDAWELLDRCKGFYLSGYHLAGTAEPFCALSLELLRRADERQKEVFFDPGPLCDQISREVLDEVLQKATVISLNSEEARKLTGCEEPAEAANALKEATGALVLLKSGRQGCYAVSAVLPGKWYPGFRVKAVDTMGAGDSFLGAFAYAWLQDWEMDLCIAFANAAGAAKAAKLGTGTQVPTLVEMLAILRQNGYNFSDLL